MNNVLFIAPHADDEIIGCGATMYKLVQQGCSVFVLISTNASIGAPELFSSELIQRVRDEAKKAHRILGVAKTLFLDLPAPAMDQYPIYKVANDFVRVIRDLEIDTVFIPHRGDCHKDHRVVHDAAMVACRPLANSTVKRVYAYETMSETEWGEPISSESFIPTKFICFTEEEYSKKLEAMSQYQCQLYEFPAARSLEAIEALAKYRGATISRVRAEAFEVLREID